MLRRRGFLILTLFLGVLLAGVARAENAAFDVLEYQVAGNSKLPAIEIERAVYPFLGERKTIADIDKARAALEQAYRQSGYPTVMVEIPVQKVQGGVVTLQVTEGKIGKVRVLDSRYYSQGRITDKLPQLASGNVPYMPQVQQELTALNHTATGRAVTPILRPGKTPGTLDVDLKVHDENPLHANIEIDNRYTPDTKPMRLNATLRYDNLWQREHSVTLQYQTAPQDPAQVRVWSGTYLFRFADPDKALALYAVHSNSNVSTVGDLSVIGAGNIFGARAVLTLPGDEHYFHTLSFGIDYKDFGQSVVLGSQSLPSPIHYLPFQIQYGASDNDSHGNTQLNLATNFSLRGVGNDADQFTAKRSGARPDYFYLKGELNRVQNLARGMSLFARFGGQFASQPLINNEQYSGGGADSVRGYLETEVLGDSGVQGTLEWRGPSYAARLSDKVQDFHFLAFVEGQRLWIQDPLPGQVDRYNLASSGFGMRLYAWKSLNVALDLALPMRDGVNTRKGDWRTQVSVSYDLL